MELANERIIELSKVKIVLLLVGAAAFLALGIWIMTLDATTLASLHRSPIVLQVIGVGSFFVFGAAAFYGVMKLLDTKPGLIFNSEGVVDNSSGVAAGLIPWSEISGVGVVEIKKQKMLVIKVINPEKYIETGSAIRRAANRASAAMVGSPLAIAATALKIDFQELQDVFGQYHAKYGNRF